MTNERTETHACDSISRQEAIDYCYQLINVEHQQGSDEMNYGQERVNQTETILHHLELMPSAQPAQPEIIYCKKCEHWTRTYGDGQWGLGDCDVFDKHLVRCNGYCAWAERRTDENNNE